MLLDQETLRFIFGMKLRNHRLEQRLSLHELADRTGLSASYINEIEKGKKYPKSDKVLLLADALGVGYDDLTSVRLSTELAFLARLLERGSLRSFPLHIFGVPAQAIMEVMADSPQKFSALIGTLLELARLYDVRVEEVFVACLKAYIDMHGNYFPDIEQKAESVRIKMAPGGHVGAPGKTRKSPGIPRLDPDRLEVFLTENFGYEVRDLNFNTLDPTLHNLLFFVVEGGSPVLIINQQIGQRERNFILAKTIGYEVLELKGRFPSSYSSSADSFDRLLHNFQASYFAGALLLGWAEMVEDLAQLLAMPKWNGSAWTKWMESGVAPWGAYLHRMAQVLPKAFGTDRLFLIEMDHGKGSPAGAAEYTLSKQLHLSDLHAPHRVHAGENYCRRWITVKLLAEAARKNGDRPIIGAQRSTFVSKGGEYLCLSVAYPKEGQTGVYQCSTIGLQVNDTLLQKVKFASDVKVSGKEVGDTCERCPIEGCEERAAAPLALQRRSAEETIQQSIADQIERWEGKSTSKQKATGTRPKKTLRMNH